MDLRELTGRTTHQGFPRPRGDGPFLTGHADKVRQVSPPTRGWTSVSSPAARRNTGFPAHAGMDRQQGSHRRQERRFPRPRGDGPSPRVVVPPVAWVSPPTRGWTRYRYHGPQGPLGFPAHAGMDPRGLRSPAYREGFPRPRGDGPGSIRAEIDALVVSPPTRGWTRRLRLLQRARVGFPAHAGMDRSRPTTATGTERFPRPRGDGPWFWSYGGLAPEVSPPTRGWTRRKRGLPRSRPGFPAHAGMDPR